MMQQVLQAVVVACCFGFGWAAGSTRLSQDRQHGCGGVLALAALVTSMGGLVWALAAGSEWWKAWVAAIIALFVGGLVAAVKTRY